MASSIHKKRTGKGFRITEEIVMKEEMYEEEDDDLPRSYRLLGQHMQTDSPELNSRVEAYLSNRVTMSTLLARTNEEWRSNEINRLFAQSFPNLGQRTQQLAQAQISQGMPPLYNAQPQSPVERPALQSISYIPRSRHRGRTQSRTSSRSDAASSRDSAVSPVAPTPGSGRETPTTTMATLSFDNAMAAGTPGLDGAMAAGMPSLDGAMAAGTPSRDSVIAAGTPGRDSVMAAGTPMGFGSSASAFTTELPPEAKMLLGGMTDVESDLLQSVYGPQFATLGQYYNSSELPGYVKPDESDDAAGVDDEYFGDDPASSVRWDSSGNTMTEESWNTFIDDAAWRHDQQ